MATRLPHINKGQFTESVGRWVNLYNKGMATGHLPDTGSYLEIMIALENEAHRTAWSKGFKV